MINIVFIAEVKTMSPFGYKSNKTWDELFAIADDVGDMISIHTSPKWGGSFDDISKARYLTGLPILAKGIHPTDEDIQRALDAGADYVLVVGRIPAEEYLNKCILEPTNLEQLIGYPKGIRAVWNSRDIDTGKRKQISFDGVREHYNGWLCQASNIQRLSDINGGANAVLIGEHLPEIAKELRQRPRGVRYYHG